MKLQILVASLNEQYCVFSIYSSEKSICAQLFDTFIGLKLEWILFMMISKLQRKN